MMKQLLLVGAMLISLPFALVSAQETTTTTATSAPSATLPASGLVPGDFFYFLDRWSEAIVSAFTFNPESKAERAFEHAHERVSEIQAILMEKGIGAPEVAQAKQAFEGELTRAAAIVANEKAKGIDVSMFAPRVDENFERSKDMLKQAYRGYRDDLKEAEKGLSEQLKEALKAGNTTVGSMIEAELNRLNDEASSALDEEGSVDDRLGQGKQHLDETLGEKQAAESHIANAERARENLVHEASVRGFTLDKEILALFDEMLKSAQSAMTDENFEAAKEYAKDAKEILNDAHKDLNTKEEEDFDRQLRGKSEDTNFFDMSDLENELDDTSTE
ncbi:MAG: DUF5667 domain-containing protein [Minisyncoccota bacterium]